MNPTNLEPHPHQYYHRATLIAAWVYEVDTSVAWIVSMGHYTHYIKPLPCCCRSAYLTFTGSEVPPLAFSHGSLQMTATSWEWYAPHHCITIPSSLSGDLMHWHSCTASGLSEDDSESHWNAALTLSVLPFSRCC